MNLTVTLHCSGLEPYGCTTAISTGYQKNSPWLSRILNSAQASGWTARPVAKGSGEETLAFCPTCTERLLDLAAGETGTNPKLDTLRDLLLLVNVTVPAEEIATWDRGQRRAAEEWASLEHLYASDNPVQRKPKPEFLP